MVRHQQAATTDHFTEKQARIAIQAGCFVDQRWNVDERYADVSIAMIGVLGADQEERLGRGEPRQLSLERAPALAHPLALLGAGEEAGTDMRRHHHEVEPRSAEESRRFVECA